MLYMIPPGPVIAQKNLQDTSGLGTYPQLTVAGSQQAHDACIADKTGEIKVLKLIGFPDITVHSSISSYPQILVLVLFNGIDRGPQIQPEISGA